MSESWILIDEEKHYSDDKYSMYCGKNRRDILEKFVDSPSSFMSDGECFNKTVAANTRDGCANKLKRRTMVVRSSDNGLIVVEGKDSYSRDKTQKTDMDDPKYYIKVTKDQCEKAKGALRTSQFLRNWDPKKHKTLPKKSPVTKKEINKVKKCTMDYKDKIEKYENAKKKVAADINAEKTIGDYPFYLKQLKKGYRIPSILKKTTLEGAANKGHITSIDKFEEQRKRAKFNYEDIVGVYMHPEYALSVIIKTKDGRVFALDSQKTHHSSFNVPDCGASKLREKSKKRGNKILDDLKKSISFKPFDVTKIKGVEKEGYRDAEMSFEKEFRRK